MKKNKPTLTSLQTAHPVRRRELRSPPWLFLASLLLSMAASQVSAGFVIGNEAVTLPDVPGLGIDFRCEDGDGGPENCPMDGNNEIGFSDDDGSKYLQFQATDDESCQFLTLTEEVDGIGIGCDDLASTDDALINQGQRLVIYVNDGEGGVSTPMDGIYLAGILNNYDDEDDECYAQSGTVEITVGFGDGSSTTIIPWASDIDLDSACEDTLHAIFVDFGGTQDVTEVSVSVDNAQPGNGVYAAGIAVGMAQGPNVNPNCFDDGEGVCTIDLVENPLPGQDIRVVIDDDDLAGNVAAVDGFPVRVLDPRPSCQKNPSGLPVPLVFNDTDNFTYYRPDLVATIGVLPLVVSDSGGTVEYLTLSGKGCGTPRATVDGIAVARNSAVNWQPYIDILAIESDIDPVDSLITYVSDNEAAYPCLPGSNPAPLPVGAALNQPLGEINSREQEVKQLAGVPGVVDPMSRDKTQSCGSRRVTSSRFSFVAYTLIHNLQTDMRGELSDEIQVMKDTVARTAACVDSSFFYGQLVAYPSYIEQFFNIGAAKALSCNAPLAGVYFDRTALLVDRYTTRLQILGSAGFARCYASGPNLDTIKASPPMALAGGDKPLNAYGDIISQLQHLSYALKTFKNELTKCP